MGTILRAALKHWHILFAIPAHAIVVSEIKGLKFFVTAVSASFNGASQSEWFFTSSSSSVVSNRQEIASFTCSVVQSLSISLKIYIQSNEIHNVVALIKFLLALRFQLYMFRTATVHPQELLCRYCMCRLWYVVRNALPDTSSWYTVVGNSSYNVVPAGCIGTYHSVHIQSLQRSSGGWTVTVRNMYSWNLSAN